MNKAIFGGALVCVLFLLAGTYFFPSSTIMWLAGTSTTYVVFRILAAIALVAVLVTNPPRKLAMRLFMGAVAIALASVGVSIALADSVRLLDMTLFILLGIAFAIEALEFNEDELQTDVINLREVYVRQTAPSAVQIRYQAEQAVAQSMSIP
jgi:hypothetical protein